MLIGIYLADLSRHDFHVDASLLGALGAVSFAAELVASIPFGIASDAISPRWLMVAGATTGALAVQLFALSSHINVFFLSRALKELALRRSPRLFSATLPNPPAMIPHCARE